MRGLRVLPVLVTVALFSCAREETPTVRETPQPRPVATAQKAGVIPGMGKVYFTEEMTALVEQAGGGVVTKSAALNDLVEALGITSMERLFPDAGEFEPRTRAEGLHRWYKVTFDREIPVTKAGAQLLSLPGVERFERCLRIRRAATNDPYYRSMWGLYNGTYGYDVNVEPAWANFTVGNPDVKVCVVDGGIQLNHPDLAWNCAASGHYNYVDGNRTIYGHDHGCHVAGTIAAVSNNGVGVAGIAGGDYAAGKRGVTLLSHQVFKTVTKNGQTYDEAAEDFERALKEGADRGAVISQNSWGYYFDENENERLDQEDLDLYKYFFENPDPAFCQAVDYFVKYAGCDNGGNQLPDSPMKGGLVVFAAGNDDIPYGPPANYEACVAVGALAPNGSRASFSDYGDWVDICAPGQDIYSTVPGSQYDSFSGTSMACPHVSGVAALIVSQFGGQGFTNEDLKTLLLEGARKIGASSGSRPIGPLADAYGSMMLGSQRDPVTPEFTAAASGNSIRFAFTAHQNFGYTAYVSETRSDLENLNPAAPPASVRTASVEVEDPDGDEGKEMSVLVTGLAFSKTYYVTMAGYSYGHKYSAPAAVQTLQTEVNHAPVIRIEPEMTFHQYENIALPLEVSELDGNVFTVTMTSSCPRARLGLGTGGAWTFYLDCRYTQPGRYNATLTATDEYGMASQASFAFTVLQNHAPVLSVPFEPILLTALGERASVKLDTHFTDEDGETLSFAASGSGNTVNPVLQGDELTVTALAEGMGVVHVSAMDGMQERAEGDIQVLVRDPSRAYSLEPGARITNTLVIRTGIEPSEVSARLVSVSGAVVWSLNGVYSAFDPVTADLSSLPPGLYTLLLSFDGKQYKEKVVKL